VSGLDDILRDDAPRMPRIPWSVLNAPLTGDEARDGCTRAPARRAPVSRPIARTPTPHHPWRLELWYRQLLLEALT
jgi:hypothetical protein